METKRFWSVVIIFHFFIVISTQIGLHFTGVREVFTKMDEWEGILSGQVVDTVGSGELELEMLNFSPENNTKVLINGIVAGYFKEPNLKIIVKNNSLVEIDSTGDLQDRTVRICHIGENIKLQFNKLSVSTKKNIVILDKIFTK